MRMAELKIENFLDQTGIGWTKSCERVQSDVRSMSRMRGACPSPAPGCRFQGLEVRVEV